MHDALRLDDPGFVHVFLNHDLFALHQALAPL